MLGLNGLIILMTTYFLGGIAIVSYFFDKKGFPRMLRVFLYILVALQQFILPITISTTTIPTKSKAGMAMGIRSNTNSGKATVMIPPPMNGEESGAASA